MTGTTVPTVRAGGTAPVVGHAGRHVRASPLTVSVMVVGAALGVALGTGPAERCGLALLGAGCALLIMIDVAAHRLPDRLIWPMTAGIVVLLGIQAVLDDDPGRWGRALLAAVVAGLLLLIMAVISPSGLGLGDVKLAVPLGFALGWFGWPELAAGLLAAFLINGLVLGGLVLLRRVRQGDDVAFGPSLVVGALVGGVVVATLM